jgi:peroxiredoxin
MNNIYKTVTALFISLLLVACSAKKETVKEEESTASAVVTTDLPAMTLTNFDGSKQSVKDIKGKTVLILFQPDCDHCQREAVEIEKNLERFNGYQLYFVSSDAIPAIDKFSSDYRLKDKANVHFAQTTVQNVLDNFGAISAPSLYIYNEQGKLVQSFNGETAIEVVLKYI